ncbi:MAG: hypothetical protein IH606_04010 [Burkholderiales bacterium]|nr:hypothetical protein [Burkholderiales bacterium]
MKQHNEQDGGEEGTHALILAREHVAPGRRGRANSSFVCYRYYRPIKELQQVADLP